MSTSLPSCGAANCRSLLRALAAVVIIAASGARAHASDPLELSVAAGFLAGRGHIGESQARIENLAGPGAAVEARVTWRTRPDVALGLYAGYVSLARGVDVAELGADVHGGNAGIVAELELPHWGELEPWVGVSTGWRELELDPERGKNTEYHAWDIVHGELGVAYRASPNLVLAPMLAVNVTTFVAQNSPQTNGLQRLSDLDASTFVFAGLQARFGDIGDE